MTIPDFDSTGKDFAQWWDIEGDWVEEPNQRRGGFSGVLKVTNDSGQTLYVKRQEGHTYRNLMHPQGQATIVREYNAYCAFNKIKVNTPEVIYSGQLGKKAILVTKELTDFINFEEWLANARTTNTATETIHQVLDAIATMLAKLHSNRLQHNCIYPKHIFIKASHEQPQVEIALLDLEKSRTRFFAKRAALHDIPQIRRHTQLTKEEWLYFVKQYEKAFGSSLPQLYKN